MKRKTLSEIATAQEFSEDVVVVADIASDVISSGNDSIHLVTKDLTHIYLYKLKKLYHTCGCKVTIGKEIGIANKNTQICISKKS